ncbi:MAG: class I SAM-dependent methyltransferase [Candidatus Baltobacteraceae bacterium]
MTADYSKLAGDYDAHRIGYSLELYSMMTDYGIPMQGKILDVACGTGLASEPFAKEGARVTGIDRSQEMLKYAEARIPNGQFKIGSAEGLPFGEGTFDAAICAQAIHWLDRDKAISEMIRVTKPGGILGIWWKSLMHDHPVNSLRQEVAKNLGANGSESAISGFLEFYRAPLADHTLRVVPWRLAVSLDRFIGYERSRKDLRDALGSGADEYSDQLAGRLREVYGEGNPLISLGYLQFLYLGRTL